MTEEKGIVEAQPTSIVSSIPMVPIEELKQLTAYVNQVKAVLMQKDKDYVIDRQGRQYTARSGFAKLSQGFTLSDDKPEILVIRQEPKEYTFKHFVRKKEVTETITTDVYGFEARVRVINIETGRYAWGEGACTIDELAMTHNMSPKWYHRALGTAKTRAWNRAVSNYVGSAEVSAEEMGMVYSDDTTDSAPQTRRKVDSEVNVTDYMKPVELKPPSWNPADELNRTPDAWDTADNIIGAWMQESGFNMEDFTVKARKKVITVVPNKAIQPNDRPAIEGVMLGGGFLPAKILKVNGWRMNRKDIVDS